MRAFSICQPCLRSFLRHNSQCQHPSLSSSGRRTRAFHSARATWSRDDEKRPSSLEDPAATSKPAKKSDLQYDRKKIDQELADLLRQFSPPSPPPKNAATASDSAKKPELRDDQVKGPDTTSNSEKRSDLRYDQAKIEQEMASLLEQFGLAEIEDTSPEDHGVEIGNDNRIVIKNIQDSKKKHKTVLVLTSAPVSLSLRDFRKLLKGGKHIEGWRGGGLEDAIPMRRAQDMRPMGEWILVFSTPWDAHVFQERAIKLRNLARNSMPTSPTSGIQPPADLSAPELEGFTIRDYTLSTPWQTANLFAHFYPFPERIQNAIDRNWNITSSSRKRSQVFPVRLWVDQQHKLALEPEVVKYLLERDGQQRGSPWDVADCDDAVIRITGDLRHEILDEGNLPSPNLGPKPSDNIRILFNTESEARRFVRIWHRTLIPNYIALNLQEGEAVLKAECLFHTDNY